MPELFNMKCLLIKILILYKTQAKKCNSDRKHRLVNLTLELVKTEFDYYKDLEFVKDNFIEPLQKSVDGDIISRIFLTWDSLYEMSKDLVTKLGLYFYYKDKMVQMKREAELIGLSQVHFHVFKIYNEHLDSVRKFYIEFCSDQKTSLKFLGSKIISDIRFKQLFRDCHRHSLESISSLSNLQNLSLDTKLAGMNDKLSINSYFIKPMQRITRYKLMFEKFLNYYIDYSYTPSILQNSCNKMIQSQTSDRERIKAVITELYLRSTEVCDQVNEACRLKEDTVEHTTRMRWVQKHISFGEATSIYDELFVPNDDKSRILIKAGSLIKCSSRRRLLAFLFSDCLLLTRQLDSLGPRLMIEDLFESEKAQSYYYILYKKPIMLTDIILPNEMCNFELDRVRRQSSFLSCSSIASISEDELNEPQADASKNQFPVDCKFMFGQKSTRKIWLLSAMSPKEKDAWIKAIKDACNALNILVPI